MSRAFVSEAAEDAAAAVLPERPVSPGPNFVTPRGMNLIDGEAARLGAAIATLGPDDADRPKLARDLRYWRSRQASAQIVPSPRSAPHEVAFGVVVTIQRGRSEERYQIVGEDEADPRNGLLSWSSPLARMLIGAITGDEIEPGGGRPAVMVVAVSGPETA